MSAPLTMAEAAYLVLVSIGRPTGIDQILSEIPDRLLYQLNTN